MKYNLLSFEDWHTTILGTTYNNETCCINNECRTKHNQYLCNEIAREQRVLCVQRYLNGGDVGLYDTELIEPVFSNIPFIDKKEIDFYINKTIIKLDKVVDEYPWYWIIADDGAWAGPKSEWESSHYIKYFEHVKNFDIVVTAGANCGMYTRMYSKKFKSVYAFEPDSLNFHCMVMNNQKPNVIKFNCALGDINQLVGVYETAPGNAGMHEVRISEADMSNSYTKSTGTKLNDFIVPMLSIDCLNLPACDLIQLDVQGWEHKCLLGAQQTINKYHPVIILEYGQQDEKIKQFMIDNEYKYVYTSGIDDVYIKG